MLLVKILNFILTLDSKPFYYRDIISYYYCTPEVPYLVSSQFLWYNSYVKFYNKVVCYKDFTDKKN